MTESVSKHQVTNTVVDPETQAPISTKPLVSKRTRRTTAVVSIVVTLVVLGILVGLGYLAYSSYDRAALRGDVAGTVRLRDIAFIVMALETLVVILLALIVVALLFVVVILIYDRVIPILEQINKTVNTVVDTAHTVRGTTTFVGEKVVSPFIKVSSYAAGAARIAKGVVDLWPRANKTEGAPAPPSKVE